MRCEISEGEVRFFSSPFFSFLSFRVISIVNGRVEKPLWLGSLGFVFSMRNVTFTSASAGFTTIHLIDEKRKAQPFQMENFVTGGGEVTLVLDVDDRGRSRPKGARREEQAIDRKTSDRLAVRARQLDRQAGPDVGEEVWRRRRPWRSPRKRRRVSETLSGTDAPPPPRSRPRLRKVDAIVTMPGSARSRHLG